MSSSPHHKFLQTGFTLVELITIMIIIGVLAAVAAPRFFDRGMFDSRSFSDEVRATLRLAQKLAIAQHRNVCVPINTAAPASLTINVSSTSAGTCNVPLPNLSGNGNYEVKAHDNVALAASATAITFDPSGSPGTAAITLQVDAEPQIKVEAETGYVH